MPTKKELQDLNAALAAENAELRAQISALKTQRDAQRSQHVEEFTDRSSALAKLKLLCMNGQRAVLRGNKLVLL